MIDQISAEKIFAQSLGDIEFICKQILRFKKMSLEEIKGYLRKDIRNGFYTIPKAGGMGHIFCGDQAWKRFDKLAKRVIDLEPSLAGRVDADQIKKELIDVFAQRLIAEHCELNQATAELILRDVIEEFKSSLEDIEHYLPCILFLNGGPDEFCVGPVTFIRKTRFLRDKRQVLRSSVVKNTQAHIEYVNQAVAKGFPRDRATTAEQSEQLVRGLQARAIKTFRGYPWVAQVKILNCDRRVSVELATKTVESALHVIRVVLGAQHTRELRLAWSRGDALRTAKMWMDVEEVIHVSVGSKSLGPVGFQNWYDVLTQEGDYCERIGSALTALVSPTETYHLQARFIDAINWFGDAATDLEHTSSLVKYVAAIERLLFGKFEAGHTKTFAKRVKLICDIFGCDLTSGSPYEVATKIYKTRSALLHGDFSLKDPSVVHLANLAEELSRYCILSAAHFYPMLLRAYKDPTSKDLESAMERIDCEGIEWLLAASNSI